MRGTPEQPIQFTSYYDDAAGGDTNNDGGTQFPSMGSWGKMVFTGTSTGSVMDRVELGYASAAVSVQAGSLCVSNCVVHMSVKAIQATQFAQVDVESRPADPQRRGPDDVLTPRSPRPTIRLTPILVTVSIPAATGTSPWSTT